MENLRGCDRVHYRPQKGIGQCLSIENINDRPTGPAPLILLTFPLEFEMNLSYKIN